MAIEGLLEWLIVLVIVVVIIVVLLKVLLGVLFVAPYDVHNEAQYILSSLLPS
jgi:hypothetical protein